MHIINGIADGRLRENNHYRYHAEAGVASPRTAEIRSDVITANSAKSRYWASVSAAIRVSWSTALRCAFPRSSKHSPWAKAVTDSAWAAAISESSSGIMAG